MLTLPTTHHFEMEEAGRLRSGDTVAALQHTTVKSVMHGRGRAVILFWSGERLNLAEDQDLMIIEPNVPGKFFRSDVKES